MVRSAKRITRKDIRRPDLFVTFTGKLFRFLEEHRTAFLLSGIALVVIFLAAWGWHSYASSQNRQAAEKYSEAVALYRKGQYQEALNALDTVQSYRLSSYGNLALLYQAHIHLALKEYDKSISSYREFLDGKSQDPFLRQLGYLSLGYAQEEAGRCEEAADAFSQAQKITGPLQEQAILGEARCKIATGALKEALEAYRHYLSTYPASEMKNEVSVRIQELEAKVGAGSGGK